MRAVMHAHAAPRMTLLAGGVLAVLASACPAVHAQALNHIFGGGAAFPQRDGESIYRDVCQGCHMPEAQGAVGAGAYPALAGNVRLASKIYPALVVINGRKAMPAFAGLFDDAQVAAVANYIRSHFGNHYPDAITASEVKALRPKKSAGPQ